MGSKRKRGAKNNSNDVLPSRKKSKDGTQASQPAPADGAAHLDLDKSPFSAQVTTNDERKREAHVYDLLGSLDSAERIAAADAVITGLLASEEPVLERHLEKRLFRGLASSRNASRVGFSLVLTEILGQLFGPNALSKTKFPGLPFSTVLDILLEKTKPNGALPGQEERDLYYGQLFGLQCFIESKVLFGDNDRWSQVMGLLLELANKKVWLRSQCVWLILETLPQMGEAKAIETIQQLIKIGLGKTAEGVGLWLRATTCYPEIKMPSKPWSHPLATKSLPELANVLKDNVKQDDGAKDAVVIKAKSGSWNAQLHFVWDLILAYYIERYQTSKTNDAGDFKLFWSTVIDDGLFSKNATEAQKFRGLMIFQKFLQGFAAQKSTSSIKALFSKNLMRCLINQSAKEDRYLHRAATKSLKIVEGIVETEPTSLLPILEEFLGKNGAYDFDQQTHLNTVEKILQHVTSDNVVDVLKFLRAPVVVVKEENEVDKCRQVYAGYVFFMCVRKQSSEDEPGELQRDQDVVLKTTLEELVKNSYSSSANFAPELSDKIRQIFRSRLASALAKLTKRHSDYRFLCDAVVTVEPTAVKMSADLEAERKSALKSLRKLTKQSQKEGSESSPSLSLAMLYAITILQLYDGDADALTTLEDLKQCSEKLKETDAAASSLLVEILLGMVSRQSPLMRQITQQVFEAFTPQLSADALEGLTEHLAAEENMKGQQALFDAEDEEMLDADQSGESGSEGDDIDDDEDEISEIGSDVEFVTLNGEEAEGEEDDDSERDDDAKAKDIADLDDALAKVLKSHRLDQDNAAETSDDDSDMTDSEMMALDEKLVEVFKQRAQKTNKSKEKKDARATMVHFKHRVLDFLDIYLKKEAHNPLAFELVLPLLGLIRSTQTKELAKKAADILFNFARVFKKGRGDTEGSTTDADKQVELLQKIHEEASLDSTHAFARAVSTTSLLVVSSLFAADRENLERAAAVYTQTQVDWTLGRKRIQPSFFTDWINWCQGHASNAKA
ncbi:DNA polymerase phi-domain-containing protein [Apiospora kogelbergensis]|uniref:DNA polymerase phi-domain-containing protein n=1 Tax=Apiospora kogelbergensis TaxID=1337665 RepID=A0AAW0Q6R7_9PEZI